MAWRSPLNALARRLLDVPPGSQRRQADERAVSDEGWQEAARSVLWAWEGVSNARTLLEQAEAVRDLDDAVSDLACWLSGDIDTGALPEQGEGAAQSE